MIGWNLPPGCTDRDIEIAQGGIAFCSQCGQEVEASALDDDEPLCAACALGDDPYDRAREES
jgi:radical SAM superfamily enzyme